VPVKRTPSIETTLLLIDDDSDESLGDILSGPPLKHQKYNPYTLPVDQSVEQKLQEIRKIQYEVESTKRTLKRASSSSVAKQQLVIEEDDYGHNDPNITVSIICAETTPPSSWTFKVRKTDPLNKLAGYVADLLGQPLSHLRFKQYSLTLDVNQTPNHYAFIDDEIIKVEIITPSRNNSSQNLAKSASSQNFTKSTQSLDLLDDTPPPSPPANDADEDGLDDYSRMLEEKLKQTENQAKADDVPKIKLCLRIQGEKKMYRIDPKKKFSELIAKIPTQPGKKIKLEFDGETLKPTDTPATHDMEDEDLIDVVYF